MRDQTPTTVKSILRAKFADYAVTLQGHGKSSQRAKEQALREIDEAVDGLAATLTARCEALTAKNDALEEDAEVDRLRIEALTAERDTLKDELVAMYNQATR